MADTAFELRSVWIVYGMYSAYGDAWPQFGGVFSTLANAEQFIAVCKRVTPEYAYEIREISGADVDSSCEWVERRTVEINNR